MKILSTRRFALWTRELRRWLSAKFDSISIDLTPVEEKLDEVEEKIDGVAKETTSQEILTAVQSVPIIPLTEDQKNAIINHVINS